MMDRKKVKGTNIKSSFPVHPRFISQRQPLIFKLGIAHHYRTECIHSITIPARRRTSVGFSTTVQCQGWLFLADGAKHAISKSFSNLWRPTGLSMKLRMERRDRKNCSACCRVREISLRTGRHFSGLSQFRLKASVGQTATQ